MPDDPPARYASMARVLALRDLVERPSGVTIGQLCEKLEVGRHTAMRLLSALESCGVPLVAEADGREKVWRVATPARSMRVEMTVARLVALALVRSSFAFLRGTGFEDDVESLFVRVEAALERKKLRGLESLKQKIFDVQESTYDYEGRAEVVNEIVTALVKEERVALVYGRAAGAEPRRVVVEPWSLVVYKKGLYVAGHSAHHGGVRMFALDGIADAEWLRGERFEYPREWDPGARFGPRFGIFDGPPTEVVVRFDAKVARAVKRRRWHASQRMRALAGGGVELRMRVRGMTEVANWVLGFGEHAEVVEPREMREEIGRIAGEMRARHA